MVVICNNSTDTRPDAAILTQKHYLPKKEWAGNICTDTGDITGNLSCLGSLLILPSIDGAIGN